MQTFWTLKLTEIWGEPKQGLTAQNEDGVGRREREKKRRFSFFLRASSRAEKAPYSGFTIAAAISVPLGRNLFRKKKKVCSAGYSLFWKLPDGGLSI